MTDLILAVGAVLASAAALSDINSGRVPVPVTILLYTAGVYYASTTPYLLESLTVMFLALSAGLYLEAKQVWMPADKHYLATPLLFIHGHEHIYLALLAATTYTWHHIHKNKNQEYAAYLPAPVTAFLITLLII